MTTSELIALGAAELARHIRSKQVSPIEVVEAHIARIESVNPAINAVVTPTFDLALTEARRATQQLASRSANLPPLFGVPVSIKDALPVAGIRFTAGSTFYRNQIANQDAEAVQRLRQAGVIILGKTNCADMSGAAETDNLVFGLTRNPWNLERSAGGSSGGEGALIAAGGSPLGLGADIGGSIRIPAAFCGVVGLKPSAGRIPTQGHIPYAHEPVHNWNTVGPLAQRVEDLALALSVLSVSPVMDYRTVILAGRRLLVPKFLHSLPVSREIANAVQRATDSLSRTGMQVVWDAPLPMLDVSLEYVAIMYRYWLPRYRVLLSGGKVVRVVPELIANLTGNGRVAPPTLSVVAMLDLFGPILRLSGHGNLERLERLRRDIIEAMRPGGLIVWPVFPTTAPKHGFVWKPNLASTYANIFNALGVPSVAVPLGLSQKGLPLGVQIVGKPGEDEIALAAAAVLECEFGGWRIAPCSL